MNLPTFVMVAVTVLCGCVTGSLPKEQLRRLDGYDTHAKGQSEREVETVAGDKVTFSRDANLYLDLPNQRVGGQFESIRVQNDVFDGRAAGGREVRVPLGEVRAATLEQPPQQGAILAVIITGVLAAAGLFLLVSVGSHQSSP